MDVHFNNWRYCKHRCDLMVHVVLPEELFDGLDFSEHPQNEFFHVHVQTLRFNEGHPEPYIRTWARRLSYKCAIGSLTTGIACSLPIFFEEKNTWHPFNIIVVKLKRPLTSASAMQPQSEQQHCYYIKFFYQTVVIAYLKACQINTECLGERQHNVALDSSLDNPLLAILKEAPVAQDTSPAAALGSLLESCAPNHQALESSVNLRGSMAAVMSPKLLKQAHKVACKPLAKKTINLHQTTQYSPGSLRLVSTSHCFTGKKIWVCAYEPLKQQLLSYIDTIPQSQIDKIDPLLLLAAENEFFFNKVNSFVISLLEECKSTSFTLHQKLPISIKIETAHNTLEYFQAYFDEACFTLRSTFNENSGWIKAAVAKAAKQVGFWADVITLWEKSQSKWGVKLLLKAPPPSPPSHINVKQLNCLLDTRQGSFFESCCSSNERALVVYSSSLDAWLILPGGFAIKGHFHYTPDELRYLVGRYGG